MIPKTKTAVSIVLTRKRGSEWPAFLKTLEVGEGVERVTAGEMQTVRKHAKDIGITIAAQAVEVKPNAEGKPVAVAYKFARVADEQPAEQAEG